MLIDSIKLQLSVLVTHVPSFRKHRISYFDSKEDLIQWIMASIHVVSNSSSVATFRIFFLLLPNANMSHTQIANFLSWPAACVTFKPWFLNGKMTWNYRFNHYIDGSIRSKTNDYFPNNDPDRADQGYSHVIWLDWRNDPIMKRQIRNIITLTSSVDGLWLMVDHGRRFAERMDQRGYFKSIPRSDAVNSK